MGNYPIDFCHIAPTKYLEKFSPWSNSHLVLAHLVEEDEEYARFYREEVKGEFKIMDNSAFEMFKRGLPMYDSSKIHDMAEKCEASCVVMTDHPGQHWKLTVEEAEKFLKNKRGNYSTFFVPQSELGDMDGLMKSIAWALSNKHIDLIGVSILACPIACGITERSHGEATHYRSEAFRLQRYLSRLTVFEEMERRGLLESMSSYKRFHCLGMTEGPNEIKLLRKYHKHISSWDSSAAVWCGLNAIKFDSSPTGLINGKLEKEVDFTFDKGDYATERLCIDNMNYINHLCATMGK